MEPRGADSLIQVVPFSPGASPFKFASAPYAYVYVCVCIYHQVLGICSLCQWVVYPLSTARRHAIVCARETTCRARSDAGRGT